MSITITGNNTIIKSSGKKLSPFGSQIQYFFNGQAQLIPFTTLIYLIDKNILHLPSFSLCLLDSNIINNLFKQNRYCLFVYLF